MPLRPSVMYDSRIASFSDWVAAQTFTTDAPTFARLLGHRSQMIRQMARETVTQLPLVKVRAITLLWQPTKPHPQP